MKQNQLYTNKGYTEYQDYARQELNDGYERNQGISAGSEIIGSAISPVKVHTPHSYTGSLGNRISTSADIAKSRFINSVGTGAINGAGYTNENNPAEYSRNITMGVGTNYLGTRLGNKIFGNGNEMYQTGRVIMNGLTDSIPYIYDLHQRKKMEDRWYKLFDTIFDIAALIMMLNFAVQPNEWLATICLGIFILYFAWYDIYAKNKKLAFIPLFLYIVGYYVIHWNSILEVTKVLWYGIFGKNG